MTAITQTQISINRYAPADVASVNLYNYNGAEGLTLGQLISAVCIARGAELERGTVTLMNSVASTTGRLRTLADYANEVVAGTSNWAAIRGFCISQCGIAADSLPTAVEGYNDRMLAFNAMRTKMDDLTSVAQQTALDLQSTINRRDVVFGTATNTLLALTKSMMAEAAAF